MKDNTAGMKARGWFALIAGLFIIGLMSWIWVFLAHAIADHRISRLTTGDATFLGTMFVAFALIIVTGFVGVVQGIVMIRSGRRNRILTVAGVVLVLAIAGTVAMGLVSHKT